MRLRRIAWRHGVAVLAFMLAAAMSAWASAPKRVLMIYQSDGFAVADLKAQQSTLNRLRAVLGQNVEFYTEELNSTRHPEFREQTLGWIRSRYANYGIDVVIFVGSMPTELLPGVPVVYVGNSVFAFSNNTSNKNNYVAVWYQIDLRKTVAAARALQPGANQVIAIVGSNPGDRYALKEARNQLQGLDIPVEYVSDATLEELLARAAHLPRNTIVLPISYTRDRYGKTYYPRDIVIPLSQVSSAPVYTVADTIVGAGPVGGYVIDYAKTGVEVADAVLQLLAGKPVAEVSIPPGGTGTYLFDSRELKRWQFSEKNLPPGSVVQFRTPTAWEQYRWRIVAIAVVIVAQFFLILRLLIAHRKRVAAEASLRDMTGRLLESQDEERRRFARDLHDGTGQHLSAITLAVGQVLARFPAGHEGLRKLLRDSHTASRQALDEVRTVSFALHPPLLDNLGLVTAIRWYLDGLEKRTDLRIHFDASDDVSCLSPESERAFFRIVQESMANVLRHSGGKRISVRLLIEGKEVTLEIVDDGRGMSAEQLAKTSAGATLGVGIAGMRERLRQLHGFFDIQSSVTGTTIIARVPVDKERYAAHPAGR